MGNADLELSGGGGGGGRGGGLDLFALLAFFPSVISSFLTQNKGGRGEGPCLTCLRSATDYIRGSVSASSVLVNLMLTPDRCSRSSVD